MATFRKKPVAVEAVLCREALAAFKRDWQSLPSWLQAAYHKGGVVPTPQGVYLPTPEGRMLARPDDWIICGVAGEVYPCKPDIFAATYEHVAEERVCPRCLGSRQIQTSAPHGTCDGPQYVDCPECDGTGTVKG